jgi:HEAT repeat protein
VEALGGFNAGTRAQVIELLGKRGDKAALAGVVGYLKSTDDGVRSAAIAAVGELGGAEQVRALLEQAKAGGVGTKAIAALARTGAPGIDGALAKLLADAGLKAQAIAALAARGSRSGAAAIIKLASDPSADVRSSAWANMAELAGEDDVPALMKVLVGIKDDGERTAAVRAIRFICSEARDRDKCFAAIVAHRDKADESVKIAILEMGSYIGTRKALELERSALKSGSAAEKAAALRALAAWPNPEAAPDLLKLAGGAGSDTEKIVALRGLIQVASKDRSAKQQFERLTAAADLAKRPEEKRMLIGVLRGNRRIESLRLVKRYLTDAAVAAEAQQAVIDLAGRIRDRKGKDEIVAALKTIVETAKDKKVARRAQDTINRLSPKK